MNYFNVNFLNSVGITMCGTLISTSAISASFPPDFPVNAMTFIPLDCAVLTALMMFLEFQRLKWRTKRLVFVPNLQQTLEKTKSYP